MEFRQDINCLRMLAVLTVLLFHFYPNIFKAGYLGVDIFFVISGFLMTFIIMKKSDSNTFNLFDFYRSRFLRVAPVLFVFVIVVVAVGYFVFPQIDYRTLGKHGLSSLLFFPNIIYYKEASSYFEDQTSVKWLLHTWSLGVEFQFYVVYPLLLLAMKRVLEPGKLSVLVLFIAITSLIGFIYASYNAPSAGFYLLPFRMWEFMAGSLAYFAAKYRTHDSFRFTWAFYFVVVLFVCLLFSAEISMNWIGNILVVLGTAYLIYTGWNDRIFAYRIFRFSGIHYLGKISYSVYIWHWPIAIVSVMAGHPLPGLLLSLFVGALSYEIVEKRFGFFLTRQSGPVMAIVLSPYVLMFFLCFGLHTLNGFENRIYPRNFQHAAISPMRACDRFSPDNSCTYGEGERNVVVVGDSLSIEMSEALLSQDVTLWQYSFSACSPYQPDYHCAQWLSSVSEVLNGKKDIQDIYVIFRLSGIPEAYAFDYMNSYLKYIKGLGEHAALTFVLSPPALPASASKYYFEHFVTGQVTSDIQLPRSDVIDLSDEYRLLFLKSLSDAGISYIDLKDIYCSDDNCSISNDGTALYFDNIHASPRGYQWAFSQHQSLKLQVRNHE